MTKKSIAFIFAGAVVAVLSSCVTAYCTYKAYPKIKDAKEEGKSNIDIAKEVAKDYAPVAAVTVASAGILIASEVMGEKDIRRLKYQVSSFENKFRKAEGWYKTLDKSVKEHANAKTQKDIYDGVKNIELEEAKKRATEDVKLFVDGITGAELYTTKDELELAVNNVINKNLCTEMGYAMYEDLYYYLGRDLPDGYEKLGWSIATASAMWLSPWCELEYEEHDGKTFFYFVADRGDGRKEPFEPLEDPESEDWM